MSNDEYVPLSERNWWGKCSSCGLEMPIDDFPTKDPGAGPLGEIEICPECYGSAAGSLVDMFEKKEGGE